MFDTLRRLFASPYRNMPYGDYLQSAHWQAKRTAAIRRAGGRCERCGATGRLEVHHRTYARLGCEADGDLMALCRACHQAIHDGGEDGGMFDRNLSRKIDAIQKAIDTAQSWPAGKAKRAALAVLRKRMRELQKQVPA